MGYNRYRVPRHFPIPQGLVESLFAKKGDRVITIPADAPVFPESARMSGFYDLRNTFAYRESNSALVVVRSNKDRRSTVALSATAQIPLTRQMKISVEQLRARVPKNEIAPLLSEILDGKVWYDDFEHEEGKESKRVRYYLEGVDQTKWAPRVYLLTRNEPNDELLRSVGRTAVVDGYIHCLFEHIYDVTHRDLQIGDRRPRFQSAMIRGNARIHGANWVPDGTQSERATTVLYYDPARVVFSRDEQRAPRVVKSATVVIFDQAVTSALMEEVYPLIPTLAMSLFGVLGCVQDLGTASGLNTLSYQMMLQSTEGAPDQLGTLETIARESREYADEILGDIARARAEAMPATPTPAEATEENVDVAPSGNTAGTNSSRQTTV